MKANYIFSVVLMALTGFLATNLYAGDIPAPVKKVSGRAVDKFLEFKTLGLKTVINKNTYRVSEQMIHFFNGEGYDTAASYHYQYVMSILISEKLTKYYFNGAFENGNLELYYKDEMGRDTAIVSQMWTGKKDGWVNSWKMVTHFDEFDNEIFYAGYQWDIGSQQWILNWADQMDIIYDSQNRIESITYSYNWGGGWSYIWKDLYEYDNGVFPIAFTELDWDDFEEIWVNDYREEYTFSNGVWSEVHGFWWDEDDELWIPDMLVQDITWLDFNDFLWTGYTLLEYDGGAWVNSEKATASYDAIKNPLFYLFQTWNGSEWVNDTRMTWEYDSFYNLTLMTYEEWYDSYWEIMDGNKFDLEYDANNNVAVEYMEAWQGPVKGWEKIHKLESWYEDVTGIPASDLDVKSIIVYPNPARNFLTIQLEGFNGGSPVLFRVLDFTGRSVITGQLNASGIETFQLDLQGLANGVYVVKVEQDNKVENVKFIKR